MQEGKKAEEKRAEEEKKGECKVEEEKAKAEEGRKEGGMKEGGEDGKAEPAAVSPPAPPEEILMRVYMHCEGCARKVKRSLKGFDGIFAFWFLEHLVSLVFNEF